MLDSHQSHKRALYGLFALAAFIAVFSIVLNVSSTGTISLQAADQNTVGYAFADEVRSEAPVVDPQPVSYSCTDEDGNDIYTPASATNDQESLDDHCRRDGRLVEQICANGWLYSQVTECPEGYSCFEGACRADPDRILGSDDDVLMAWSS